MIPCPAASSFINPTFAFLPLELCSVVVVAHDEVGHVEQLAGVTHVLLDVFRLQLIQERIRVSEEELGILPILRLHEVVVEAG